MSEALIGIDIGGTAVKLGLVRAGAETAAGAILARRLLPLDPGQSLHNLVDRLAAACRALEDESGLRAATAGVSTPGHADPVSGILTDGGGNVPALRQGSLAEALSARLGLDVVMQNDGVAAAFGELRFGIGARFRRFVLVTLGTGVGGSIVIDGQVMTGSSGAPPEIGAMVLDADGPANRDGLPGTFEYHACAEAFLRCYAEARGDRSPGLTVAALFARFDGDAAAASAVDKVARRIAQALGSLINALNLDACLLGGGIAAAGHPLVSRIEAHLPTFTWPALLRHTQVAVAATGNDAGLLGAAALAGEAMARTPTTRRIKRQR